MIRTLTLSCDIYSLRSLKYSCLSSAILCPVGRVGKKYRQFKPGTARNLHKFLSQAQGRSDIQWRGGSQLLSCGEIAFEFKHSALRMLTSHSFHRAARCSYHRNALKVEPMSKQSSSIEIIEKRRFLRLNDYFKVSFQPAGEFGEEQGSEDAGDEVGFSKNLSLGGVAFVTDSTVAKSDYIRATIQIPELDDPIEVVGQVIRADQVEGGRIEVAVKFLPFGIDEEQRNKLELFIYDHFLTDPLA